MNLSNQLVVLAQAAGPDMAVQGGATLSVVVLLGVAAYLAVRTKGAQWHWIGLGVLIGVAGANSFVGTLAWAVIKIILKLVEAANGAATSGG